MKKQTAGSMSPMDYAMKYLALKDRTVSEMQTYLDGKDFGEADVDATVERLIELRLLDDRRYAQAYVRAHLQDGRTALLARLRFPDCLYR